VASYDRIKKKRENIYADSLAFLGIFRGALDVSATRISDEMKFAAAHLLAGTAFYPGCSTRA